MNLIKKLSSILLTPRSIAESAIGSAIAGLSLITIPFFAMQYTTEVVWDIFDFGFAWALIFAAGFSFQLISFKSENHTYKIASGLAVFTILAILWVNEAVGIIGNEDDPLNLLFGVVLLMVFCGSYIARLEAKAMTRVMVSTALTHGMITSIGTIIYMSENPDTSLVGIIIITLIFIMLWLLSAMFYKRTELLITTGEEN